MSEDITRLLISWRGGDTAALDNLIAMLYPQLKKMADGYMRKESHGHTLQATAVVNEAYMRLYSAEINWQDRAHFLSVVSTTMRRILVDHVRGKSREKRGGNDLKVTFDESLASISRDPSDVLAIDSALTELLSFDERGAKLLEMRIFSGMTMNDIAEVLDISLATAERNFKSVRAWLHARLNG